MMSSNEVPDSSVLFHGNQEFTNTKILVKLRNLQQELQELHGDEESDSNIGWIDLIKSSEEQQTEKDNTRNVEVLYRSKCEILDEQSERIQELEIENKELKLELNSRRFDESICCCIRSESNCVEVKSQDIYRRNDELSVVPEKCSENKNFLLQEERIRDLDSDLHLCRMELSSKTIELNRIQALLARESLELAKLSFSYFTLKNNVAEKKIEKCVEISDVDVNNNSKV
ncbi:Uncharacterised protein g6188 [Pycnogonum litorale]